MSWNAPHNEFIIQDGRGNQFALTHKLGAGAYGTAYQAVWRNNNNEKVVVKQIKPLWNGSFYDTSDFVHEKNIYVHLERQQPSNYVARMKVLPFEKQEFDYGYKVSMNMGYIVMGLYGDSVEHYLRDTVMRPREASRDEQLEDSRRILMFMRQAAEGLQYLHQHCVAHHDIKPGNMVISDDVKNEDGTKGRLTIVDMGLACYMGECMNQVTYDVKHNVPVCFYGDETTPGYNPKEFFDMKALLQKVDRDPRLQPQINQLVQDYNYKSYDIFSLGQVFRHMVSDRGWHDYDISNRIQEIATIPGNAAQYVDCRNDPLKNLIVSMLDTNWQTRPSIEAVLTTLGQVVLTEPFSITNPSATSRAKISPSYIQVTPLSTLSGMGSAHTNSGYLSPDTDDDA
jgi:serine/threonine protein kinase